MCTCNGILVISSTYKLKALRHVITCSVTMEVYEGFTQWMLCEHVHSIHCRLDQ